MHALIEIVKPVDYLKDRRCIVYGVSSDEYLDYVDSDYQNQILKQPYSKGSKLLKTWLKEKVELKSDNLMWYMSGNKKFIERNIWAQRKMMWLLGYDPVLIEYDVVLNPYQFDRMIERVLNKIDMIQDYSLHLERMLIAAKIIDYSDDYRSQYDDAEQKYITEVAEEARDARTSYFETVQSCCAQNEYKNSLERLIKLLKEDTQDE